MAALVRVTCGLSRLYPSICSKNAYQTLLKLSTAREPYIDVTYCSNSQQLRRSSGEIRPIFKTSELDPGKHTLHNEGLFYSIPEQEYTQYVERAARPMFNNLTKAFNERCLMVRQPALEIIENLKVLNYNMPVVRHVLYGRPGVGKSLTLGHVIHYCASQGWLILHLPWAAHYIRYLKEAIPSKLYPDRVDSPYEAVEWLATFAAMNKNVLEKYDLRITKTYTWSKREVSESGSTFLELVAFALGRGKYATDAMGVILKEIREQASGKNLKVLVAIDGVNALWSTTNLKIEKGSAAKHHAGNLSLVHQWKKMINNNWTSGAVVTTVDGGASMDLTKRREFMPLALLEKEGFECLDPHLPVYVPPYSDKELCSSVEYYMDRKWITNPAARTEDGRKELMFLSSNNPLHLYHLTRRW